MSETKGMNTIEMFIARWFDCNPEERLPEPLRNLCLPFVTTLVFAGERAAREWLGHEARKMMDRYYTGSLSSLRSAMSSSGSS